LSYTTFQTSRPALAFDKARKVWRATAKVTNTGQRAGAQVLQAYVSLPEAASLAGAPQPPKRLVGFGKVELAPGASKSVTITIDPAASNHPLSVWSEAGKKWIIASGEYTVWIGHSSSPADLAIAGTFTR
jgi:beta-glucosidase